MQIKKRNGILSAVCRCVSLFILLLLLFLSFSCRLGVGTAAEILTVEPVKLGELTGAKVSALLFEIGEQIGNTELRRKCFSYVAKPI